MPVLPSDGGSVGKKGEGRSSSDVDPPVGLRSFARANSLEELGSILWSTPFVLLVAAQLLTQLDRSVSSRAGITKRGYTKMAHQRTADQRRRRQRERRCIQARLSARRRVLAKTLDSSVLVQTKKQGRQDVEIRFHWAADSC
jgi:hypothetical protein